MAIISSKRTDIRREEVLEWFGGIDLFKKYHLEKRETLLADKAFEDILKF